jgi:plasmid stabilization system protein ParE
MKVVFTTAARLELASIFVWLEPRRPAAAERLLRQIEQLKQNLVEFPYMGRRKYRSDVRIMPIHGSPTSPITA